MAKDSDGNLIVPRWAVATVLALCAGGTLGGAALGGKFGTGSIESRISTLEANYLGLRRDIEEVKVDLKEILRKVSR